MKLIAVLLALSIMNCASAVAQQKGRPATCEDNAKVLVIIASEAARIEEGFKKKSEHLNTVLAFELAGLEILYKRVKEFDKKNCSIDKSIDEAPLVRLISLRNLTSCSFLRPARG